MSTFEAPDNREEHGKKVFIPVVGKEISLYSSFHVAHRASHHGQDNSLLYLHWFIPYICFPYAYIHLVWYATPMLRFSPANESIPTMLHQHNQSVGSDLTVPTVKKIRGALRACVMVGGDRPKALPSAVDILFAFFFGGAVRARSSDGHQYILF